MSRIGRGLISSDDSTGAVTLPSAPDILPQIQGGTGQDTSASTGVAVLSSGTWGFSPAVVMASTQDGATSGEKIQAAIDALPATGGVVDARGIQGAQTISTQIDVDKAAIILLGNATYTCPASGYAFVFTINDSGIEGTSGTLLTATAGCTGVIHNNQTQRCHYWNFKIDPNNVENAKIFHHDGGWYIDVKNMEILKENEHATTVSVCIESTNTGVPGTTGSYGGAYVGTYENVVAKTIQLTGDAPTKVTTLTFTNPDTAGFIATDALAITCLQPVVQKTGGTMFALDNVSGWTNIGGDFEGTGSTIYSFANTCRGIISIGNQISGATNTYFSGLPTANSRFLDDDTDAVTGIIKGNIGSVEPMEFGNYGFTVRHRSGVHYVGTENTVAANLKRTSATEADLDDVSAGGMALSLNTSGQMVVHSATAGSNPRTLVLGMQLDGLGLYVANIVTYADNAAALAGGLTAGRFYKTASGQLMIVY